MNRPMIQPDLEKEYLDFSSSEETQPPSSISSAILIEIHERMTPPPYLVFLKLAAVVFTVGLMNLTLCPQFGLGFARHSGLMEFFMNFGSQGCRIACGAFFLGSGLFLASIILNPEDILVARKSIFLQASFLGAIALVAFVACGAEVYFQAALLWLMGSIVGGTISMELGFMIKRYFVLKANSLI